MFVHDTDEDQVSILLTQLFKEREDKKFYRILWLLTLLAFFIMAGVASLPTVSKC